MVIKKIKDCLKTEIKNYYKVIKIICTSPSKLLEEEKKLKKHKKNTINKLLSGYRDSIKDTHEEDEIKEQLIAKREFYERYCDLYMKDPITGYIEGTDEFNIINILNDMNDGKIKVANIVLRMYLTISIIVIIILGICDLN